MSNNDEQTTYVIDETVVERYSISPGSSEIIDIRLPFSKEICAFTEKMILGPNLAPSATGYDPNNYTSLETRLNDENLGSIIYNNSQPNTDPVWFGLDFGSATDISAFKFYDYQSSSVYTSDYDFQGSNNGSTWTNIHSVTGAGYNPNGYEVQFSTVSFRYYRIINTTNRANTTYWVVSELELYEGLGTEVVKNTDISVTYNIAGDNIILKNNSLIIQDVIIIMK